MDGPSRLSKKSSAFFGSLQNASLFVSFAVQKAAAVRRKRLVPQAVCRHSIQHGGTPAALVLPLRNGTLFLQAKVFRQAEGTVRMDGPFFHLFIPRSYTQGAFLYSGVKWLTMLA